MHNLSPIFFDDYLDCRLSKTIKIARKFDQLSFKSRRGMYQSHIERYRALSREKL